MFASLSAEAIFEGKGLFGGIASFTRQRTTRGLPAKRKRMLDGSVKPSAELHVNTNNLMEMGYEFVDGKPLAAAAKLRSGTYLLTFLAIFAMSDQHVEVPSPQ